MMTKQELIDNLNRLNLPEGMKDISKIENLRWLSRNICIHNTGIIVTECWLKIKELLEVK